MNRILRSPRRCFSAWRSVPMAPPDKIFGLTVAYQNDPSPNKINLGVGAYRDDQGKPFVLESVKEAERRILEKSMNHEYAPIHGNDTFIKLSEEFTFGENCDALKEKRIASIQCLSGTGSLRVFAECYRLTKNSSAPPNIYLSNPTWANHINIFNKAGLNPMYYGYYDADKNGFNVKLMLDDLDKAENESLFCFHACAHNPTGSDPSKEEWSLISEKVREKNHLIFFDNAYQDAYAVRKFIEDGHNVIVSQSYSKNFGLYGERIGCLSIVTKDSEEASRVLSLMKATARAMYSNPPIYGARIISEILLCPDLKSTWRKECASMTDRIIRMREQLRSELIRLGSAHNWDHITNQSGMFCYSGLSKDQIDDLKENYHIYCTDDGRISIAGVSSNNVGYLAKSIHEVTK